MKTTENQVGAAHPARDERMVSVGVVPRLGTAVGTRGGRVRVERHRELPGIAWWGEGCAFRRTGRVPAAGSPAIAVAPGGEDVAE